LSAPTRIVPFRSIAELGDQTAAAIARHMDVAFRELVGHGPKVTTNDQYVRLMTGLAHPFGNFVLVRVGADERTALEATEPLAKCDAPALVILMEQAGAEVEAAIQSLGFKPEEAMPAMAVEINRLPKATLPSGYSFVRIGDDPAVKDKWTKAFAEGFEFPKEIGDAFSSNQTPFGDAPDAPRQFFAIEMEGEFVATTMLHLAEGLAGIYCVSTIPAARGKGLGAYCTVEPLRRAWELGYRVGILQATVAGHPIYLRLGFADFGHVPMYLRIPE
jgi:GNAT superfamily N-acetyltransferase